MPQANDAELTELYTASATNRNVENNEPNADGPANTFVVRLQGVAGSVRGNDASNYTLRIDCIDDTLAAPNGGMSIAPQGQDFSNAAGSDWQPAGSDFVKEQTETITVDPGAAGHVLHYVATLVGVNNDVVSFIESNRFILVAP